MTSTLGAPSRSSVRGTGASSRARVRGFMVGAAVAGAAAAVAGGTGIGELLVDGSVHMHGTGRRDTTCICTFLHAPARHHGQADRADPRRGVPLHGRAAGRALD